MADSSSYNKKRKYNVDIPNTENIYVVNKVKKTKTNDVKKNDVKQNDTISEVLNLFTEYNNIINIYKSGNAEEISKLREKYTNEYLTKLYKEYDYIIDIYNTKLFNKINNEIYSYVKYSCGWTSFQLSLEFNVRKNIYDQIYNIIKLYCKNIEIYENIKQLSISQKVEKLFINDCLIKDLKILCKNTDVDWIFNTMHFIPKQYFMDLIKQGSEFDNIIYKIRDQFMLEKATNLYIQNDYVEYKPNLWDKMKSKIGYEIPKQTIVKKTYLYRFWC